MILGRYFTIERNGTLHIHVKIKLKNITQSNALWDNFVILQLKILNIN